MKAAHFATAAVVLLQLYAPNCEVGFIDVVFVVIKSIRRLRRMMSGFMNTKPHRVELKNSNLRAVCVRFDDGHVGQSVLDYDNQVDDL